MQAADWLHFRGNAFTDGIDTATLDPFRGYAKATRDEWRTPPPSSTRFMWFRSACKPWRKSVAGCSRNCSGTAAARTIRSPRSATRCGPAPTKLTGRQIERIEAGLQAGDPHLEVTVAWRCHQRLRSAFAAESLAEGKKIALSIVESFPSCPIPEIARLGRTLAAWRQQFLAYFTTGRASNGGTEAINGIIELHRRIARGFRNPANYRLRMILAAGKLTHPNLR